MKKILISYYSYKPRLRVHAFDMVQELPIPGDLIHIPGKHLEQVALNMKNRELIIDHGMMFKVVQRTLWLDTPLGEAFRIEVEPEKPLQVEKSYKI